MDVIKFEVVNQQVREVVWEARDALDFAHGWQKWLSDFASED